MRHEFEIECPWLGNDAAIDAHNFEVEVVMVYGGDPGRTYGPPELCYPAEGPEFEWAVPRECPECKHSFTDEEFKVLEAAVEQQIADADWTDDPPDYDELQHFGPDE